MTAVRITYRANAQRDHDRFAHQHLEISFDKPAGVSMTDATFLAQELVLLRLGERCRDRRRCRAIFGKVFKGEDFDDYLDGC